MTQKEVTVITVNRYTLEQVHCTHYTLSDLFIYITIILIGPLSAGSPGLLGHFCHRFKGTINYVSTGITVTRRYVPHSVRTNKAGSKI